MKMPVLKRNRDAALPGVSGPARLDRRTKSLVRRLRPGDIAVIDHVDLDRASAEALVGAQVAAVINVAPSISGRYPNLGPQVLIDAGIPLADADPQVFGALKDGDVVRLDGNQLWRADELIAGVMSLGQADVADATEAARSGMTAQLEAFSANATEFIRRERALLLDGAGLPPLRTKIRRRPVVVVMRRYEYKTDLRRLRKFIRERNPVLIGVDEGAKVLVDADYTPDVVLGDLDTMPDSVLRSGAEVVVRATRDGRLPGMDRLERLGVTCEVIRTSASTEDAALLLAHAREARLIVTVGSHATLEEFLDKGRSGMASTFLTRLRVGPSLVEARTVQRFYRSPVRTWQLMLLALVGLLAVALAVAATPMGADWADDARTSLTDLWSSLWGWFT